jgi:peptide/nickel transport system substrate-binding protein
VIAHIRWQALLVLVSIVLVLVMAVYLAINFTTVVVPDQGGTYLEGVVGIPQYVNPILCQFNPVDRDLVELVFDGLTKVSDKGQLVDNLAESHEVTDGGLGYVFHLRRNVKWHDGVPFNADDVVFTIGAIQAPDFQGAPTLAQLWRNIKVQKVDDATVKFTLPEPFTPFLDYTTVGILPAHLLKDVPPAQLPKHSFNLQPIGTGPFVVKKVTAELATLEAKHRSWAHMPYLSRIEMKFFPSYEALFNAYDRGQVEGVPGIRPQDIEWVQKRDALQLFTARTSGFTLIYLNQKSPSAPFFQDKKVRQALLYGLDRQKLIDLTLNGQGIVGESVIMPDSWAYDSQIKNYPFDLVQAKKLLEEAGWVDADGDGIREKNGAKLQFALLGSDDAQRVKMMEEISRQWEALGVKAQPQTAGVSGLVADFLRPRRFDALLTEWLELTPDPDPYPMWHSTQSTEDGQNYAGYANPDADLAIEEARRITDPTRRTELYSTFQKAFADDVPALILNYPVYSYAVDRLVHGVQLGPMLQPSDRFRTVDQWYIATRRVIVSVANHAESGLTK